MLRFPHTFLLLLSLSFYAQDTSKFKSKQKYLSFAEKKFDISPSELFYISSDLNVKLTTNYSAIYFIKGDKLTTLDEVQEAMKVYCSGNKVLRRLTLEDIERTLAYDPFAETFSMKSISSDKIYKPNPDELIVVFIYVSTEGKRALMYIKERNNLVQNLGIKSFILSYDDIKFSELP